MHWLLFFCLNIVLVTSLLGKNVGREPRFIRGTYTSTVFDVSTVTSLVPSSCVQVDATLPPCRSVRFLNFPQFVQNQSLANPEPHAKSESPAQATPLGWGEYLGIYAPTVTVTETHIVKTIVPDPRIVVTFSVKGCRPMKIPMDLDRCPAATETMALSQVLPTSTVAPILPTATMSLARPVSTKLIEVTEGTFIGLDENQFQLTNNLEGSDANPEHLESDQHARVTEPLTF